MKIVAIVILYNPDLEDAINNIKLYIDYVDVVLVWKNSKIERNESFNFSDKIILCGEEKNDFISKPLNFALSYCLKNNYEWLLTMDQDSKWANFKTFVDDVESSSFSNVALFAPNPNERWELNEDIFVDAENVITSGSLYNINNVSKIGGFREDYKIYWVDGEYCYWIRKNGLKIKVDTSAQLRQSFGKREKHRLGIITYNYAPDSLFFLFRNMLWMHREFGSDAVSNKCLFRTFYIYFMSIALAEKKKTKKLLAIAKGVWQGLFYGIPQPRQK